ncbi:MAG: 30S ribosome-binding factor RbfA [Myxococcota bacterium]|nr:30S ribosome-binding factor RbfA [Myxococcota bacterium]
MSSSSPKRPQRVGQLIHKEVSRLLVQGLKDPRVGFATVTEVRVSGDLRHAKVFVSIYEEGERRQETLDGLQAAAGFFKREISHNVRIRWVPELHFALDEGLERAQRMEELIGAIARGEQEAPEAKTSEVLPVVNSRSAMAERKRDLDEKLAEAEKQRTERTGRKPGRRDRRSSKRKRR